MHPHHFRRWWTKAEAEHKACCWEGATNVNGSWPSGQPRKVGREYCQCISTSPMSGDTMDYYSHFRPGTSVRQCAFLQSLNRALDIRLRLSTAHHCQTDGLPERAIQSLKQYLRIYCHDRQRRWARWLPSAEFAYNSSAHIWLQSSHQCSQCMALSREAFRYRMIVKWHHGRGLAILNDCSS